VAEPADAAGELSVRHLVVAAVDGHLIFAPGLQVPVDDQACVVPLGCRDHVSLLLDKAFVYAGLVSA
jgi:hypothetical protein